MASVLLTGFEPFDANPVNASWEAARRVPDLIDDVAIERLPVVFGTAGDRLAELAEQHDPALIIAAGEAGGRTRLGIERVAINLIDARIPDNAGHRPRNTPIDPDGPVAYWTDLPVNACADAVADIGVPIEISYSAGTYVCNQVFYTLQHSPAFAVRRTGFVHVPAGDALNADAAARGLAAIIGIARSWAEPDTVSKGGPLA